MQIFRSWPNLAQTPPLALAIGHFDGLHTGHQQLLNKLSQNVKSHALKTCVLSFWPSARDFFAKKDPCSKPLLSLDDRHRAFEELELDILVEPPFDEELAQTSAHDFLEKLKNSLCLKGIVTGYDFRFGAGRKGGEEELRQFANSHSLFFENINAINFNNQPVSSTRIRKALNEGDVSIASQLLGRPHRVQGEVAHGLKLGRRLGVRTANIESTGNLLPKNGVYCGFASLADNPNAKILKPNFSELLPAVANLGYRPTVETQRSTPLLEIHLLDLAFSPDLYQSQLVFYFIERIRDEIQFDSLDALKEQISEDIRIAKSHLELSLK